MHNSEFGLCTDSPFWWIEVLPNGFDFFFSKQVVLQKVHISCTNGECIWPPVWGFFLLRTRLSPARKCRTFSWCVWIVTYLLLVILRHYCLSVVKKKFESYDQVISGENVFFVYLHKMCINLNIFFQFSAHVACRPHNP